MLHGGIFSVLKITGEIPAKLEKTDSSLIIGVGFPLMLVKSLDISLI
jgi:hypothetical protein